jgi:hypothetical protein
LYIPVDVGMVWTPLWWWETYTEYFSLMPAFVPAALIMGLKWLLDETRFSPRATVATVVLSLSPLILIGVLGLVARRGLAWKISCLIFATVLSALSTLVLLVMFSIPT